MAGRVPWDLWDLATGRQQQPRKALVGQGVAALVGQGVAAAMQHILPLALRLGRRDRSRLQASM